jgi:membrane-bound lytic murein transglycosylase B
MVLFLCCILFGSSTYAQSRVETSSVVIRDTLIERLSETLPREYVISVLCDDRFTIDSAIVRIARAPSRKGNYAFLFDSGRIARGVAYRTTHREYLAVLQKQTTVSPEVIVATVAVETDFGKVQGAFPVVTTLFTRYALSERMKLFWFGELEAFLRLALIHEWDPFMIHGSSAGAFGIPQFMPTSYFAFAIDGDGDGVVDLLRATRTHTRVSPRTTWRTGGRRVTAKRFSDTTEAMRT